MEWIDGGPDVLARVHVAERVPMGVHTDPIFDRDVLEPRVAATQPASARAGPQQLVLSAEADCIEASAHLRGPTNL